MSLFARIRAWLFGGSAVVRPQLPASSLGTLEAYTINPGESLRAAIERNLAQASGSGGPPKGEIPDIPLTFWTNWSVQSARLAVDAFVQGTFTNASLLVESMLGDDRIQGALNGRIKGVTKCDLALEPVEGFDDVAERLKELYPDIFPQEIIESIRMWSIFMGFCLVELVWETDPKTDEWVPRLKVWHPYFIYYRVDLRRYIVVTADGLIEVEPEDPKWLLVTPKGSYRGWMFGAVRSVWAPWMQRQATLRQWMSSNEIFGTPVRILKVPAQFSDTDKARVTAQVASMGSKTVVSLPSQGGPDGVDFDLKVLETKPEAWKTFPGILAQTDQSITLCIRGTNLTTSVEGGSYAAAETHRDEDEDYAQADRKQFSQVIDRVFKLWCLYNRGTPDVSPQVSLISPEVNKEAEAKVLKGIADAVTGLKSAGFNIDQTALAERFGVPLLPVTDEERETTNTVVLAPTDVAKVVTVNEARSAQKLGPLLLPDGTPDPDGSLTIEQFAAKRSAPPVPPPNPLDHPALKPLKSA